MYLNDSVRNSYLNPSLPLVQLSHIVTAEKRLNSNTIQTLGFEGDIK